MERKLPKNVRQIGNVSDNPKIYVEDYVDTFLAQLCEKTGSEPQGAFLIGEAASEDGQDYIYIYGAVRMHAVKQSGNELAIGEEVWKRAYEDCKQYFEDGEMLGWFLTMPGGPLTLTQDITKIHKKSFPKKNSVLILEEPVEREEVYYATKFGELMEIGGHYVYYEKNPCMQNYMISTRKKNGVTPSETVEDRAAKDFRSLIRTRGAGKEQKKLSRVMYAASTLLLLVIIVMGVTTINNFDKMKSVETSLETITDKAQNKKDGQTTAVDAAAETKDTADADESKTADTDQTTATDAAQTTEADASLTAAVGQTAQETSGNVTAQTTDDKTTTGSAAQAATGESTNTGSGVYTVESGDTLAIISQKSYGDISHVDAICRMNGLTDGNLIYVGQKLLLP